MFTKQMHLPLNHLPNPVSFFTAEKTLLHVYWWVRGKVCNLTIETVLGVYPQNWWPEFGFISIVIAPIYISVNSVWGYLLTSTCFLHSSHSGCGEMESQCHFSVPFLPIPPLPGSQGWWTFSQVYLLFVLCVSGTISLLYLLIYWLAHLFGGTWFFAYFLTSLDINPISCLNVKDFSPILQAIFTQFTVSFAVQKTWDDQFFKWQCCCV